MASLKCLNLGKRQYQIYNLRNELHFSGEQPPIQELFYLRFNNAIHGFEVLSFQDPPEINNVQQLYSEFVLILDEELCWKIIGFQQSNQPLSSKDIVSICDFSKFEKYASTIEQMRIRGRCILSSCKVSECLYSCLLSNEENSDIPILLEIKCMKKKLEVEYKKLDLSFKYPSYYEKRKTILHKLIPDSILGERQNAIQNEREFLELFLMQESLHEKGQQIAIVSFLISKVAAQNLLSGNVILENLGGDFLEFFVLGGYEIVLIFKNKISTFNINSKTLSIFVDDLDIKGCSSQYIQVNSAQGQQQQLTTINSALVVTRDNIIQIYYDKQTKKLNKSEVCKLSSTNDADNNASLREVVKLKDGNCMGRFSDNSVVILEIKSSKVIQVRTIHTNQFFSLEQAKVAQRGQYSQIYASKKISEFSYVLEKHFSQDTVLYSDYVFTLDKFAESLFLSNKAEFIRCINTKDGIYLISDELLNCSIVYQVKIGSNSSTKSTGKQTLCIESIQNNQLNIQTTSCTLEYSKKSIEYKTNQQTLMQVQITYESIFLRVEAANKINQTELEISKIFGGPAIVDIAIVLKDTVFLVIEDCIHMIILDVEGLVNGYKTVESVVKKHLVQRLEIGEEVESLFCLNNYQMLGLKKFGSENISIMYFDRDKKTPLTQMKTIHIGNEQISSVTEHSLTINNTAYLMKEVEFLSKSPRLLILCCDDLIENKMNPNGLNVEYSKLHFIEQFNILDNNADRNEREAEYHNYLITSSSLEESRITWTVQSFNQFFQISLSKNQIISTAASNSLVQVSQLQFECKLLEPMCSLSICGMKGVPINSIQLDQTNHLNIFEFKQDESTKTNSPPNLQIQLLQTCIPACARTQLSLKQKKLNMKPLHFCFPQEESNSMISFVLLSQSEALEYFVHVFSSSFQEMLVVQLSSLLNVSGLFYSSDSHLIGVLSSSQKFTTGPDLETINNQKESKIIFISVGELVTKQFKNNQSLMASNKKSKFNNEWLSTYMSDPRRQYQKSNRIQLQRQQGQVYYSLSLNDEQIVSMREINKSSFIIILSIDKIFLSHLIKGEGEQSNDYYFTMLYAFEWENSLYHSFKNEIPPQELDMLEFMRDFKDNNQFSDILLLFSQISQNNMTAQCIALTDDSQLNWIEIDTSSPSLIKSLTNINCGTPVRKLLSYNEVSATLLVLANSSDIYEVQLTTQEKNNRQLYEMVVNQEPHTLNEEVLEIGTYQNYPNKKRSFEVSSPDSNAAKFTNKTNNTSSLSCVALKRGGLMEVFPMGKFSDSVFSGYI